MAVSIPQTPEPQTPDQPPAKEASDQAAQAQNSAQKPEPKPVFTDFASI